MEHPSTIPPLHAPEDEARILDPTHPDFDPEIHAVVNQESVTSNVISDFGEYEEIDTSGPNRADLLSAYGDIVECGREDGKHCLCPKMAASLAQDSCLPTDNRGVFEDSFEDVELGSKGILYGVKDEPEKPVEKSEYDRKMEKDELSITRAMLIHKIRESGSFENVSPEELMRIAPTPGQLQALVTGITGIPPNSTFKPNDAFKSDRRADLEAAEGQASTTASFPSISPSPEETLLKNNEEQEV